MERIGALQGMGHSMSLVPSYVWADECQAEKSGNHFEQDGADRLVSSRKKFPRPLDTELHAAIVSVGFSFKSEYRQAMITYIYQRTSDSLRKVYELTQAGDAIIVCPVCSTKLIVALTREAANLQQVFPGLYCPVDRSHVCEILHFRPRS